MADVLTPEQISQILQGYFDVIANREYIGGKVCPTFGRRGEMTIEWDNVAPYEPLTVVLYEGTSYTSRQYVPTGVEITNTDFWAKTGDYNAQVQALRDAVDTITYNSLADKPKINGTTLVGNIAAADLNLPSPTDAQVDDAVSDWLTAHPEATTTVQDGAISTAKLADGAVTDAKLAQTGGILERFYNVLNVSFDIPKCMVWGNASFYSNSLHSSTTRACTRNITFKDNVLVQCASGVKVNVQSGSSTLIDWTTNDIVVPANTDIRFNFAYADDSSFDGDAFSGFTFKTSQWGFDQFVNDYFIEFDKVQRLEAYNSTYTQWVNTARKGIFSSGNSLDGFLDYSTNNDYCHSLAPFYAKTDMTIVVGARRNATVKIDINGTISTYGKGSIITIPANTYFSCMTYPDKMQQYVLMIPHNTSGTVGSQAIYDSNLSARVDCAFMTDNDTIFMINRSDVSYLVYRNGSVIQSETALDGQVGHANTCNYLNGKAYISDWTDEGVIHVYDVDTENLTMAFSHDITIPYGSTDIYASDCFVVDENERQILVLGYQYPYNRTTNETQNLLLVEMWNKRGNTYEKSWSKTIPSPIELQGMTYLDNAIYYLANDLDYYHVAIVKIDLASGVVTKSAAPTGALATAESEAILPIDDNNFIIVANKGRVYVQSFN